jgi:O-antigen/teichoic acid export membrane protein
MDTTVPPKIMVSTASEQGVKESTKKHIRGSSLLLVGRGLSLATNFAVQVLTVRYLSKSDYGAFAYALSLVSLGSSLSVFGLDKTITRFVPIYQEKGDYNKLFGSIIMMVGAILSIGLALMLLVFGLQGVLTQRYINDPQAVALLVILIALSPIQALDELLVGMFAIFASPSAIFFRKHVLGPGLKLAAVLLLVLSQSGVRLLAVGYLFAGFLGVLIYTIVLIRLLSSQGLFQYFNLKTLQMPFREVFGFSVPLLTTDMVFLMRSSLVVVFLEYFNSTVDVATFRAVVPVARLNMVVLQSFTFLFMPIASRLFAKDDKTGINDLYWQTAIWIAVISFPIFAVTFGLAKPVTLLFFGERYTQSAVVLALLSFGNYFNAALGFNALTLRVFGKVRYIMVIDFLALAASLALNLLLIPRYGALGGAIATSGTLVVHNILNHAGLKFGTNIRLFQWRYLRVYLAIALGASSLMLFQWLISASIYLNFALVAIVSLLVIVMNRDALDVENTFPEILRFPLIKRVLVK